MLNSFQFSIIRLEEAKKLIEFIEKVTATKGLSRNYEKMGKEGIIEVYNELREFVDSSTHYENYLKYFDSNDYKRSDEG